MKLLKVEMEIYHLKRHFKVDRHQMSHCYLSVKAKNNTRKWYFEYFIADYFPTLNKKDPVVSARASSDTVTLLIVSPRVIFLLIVSARVIFS